MTFRFSWLVLLTIGIAGCSSASQAPPEADAVVVDEAEFQAGDDAAMAESGDPLVAEVITLEPEGQAEPTRPPTLVDMDTVESFKEHFEAGQGKTRLVLLLSPT